MNGNGKFDWVWSNMAANVMQESASKESNPFHSIHVGRAKNCVLFVLTRKKIADSNQIAQRWKGRENHFAGICWIHYGWWLRWFKQQFWVNSRTDRHTSDCCRLPPSAKIQSSASKIIKKTKRRRAPTTTIRIYFFSSDSGVVDVVVAATAFPFVSGMYSTNTQRLNFHSPIHFPSAREKKTLFVSCVWAGLRFDGNGKKDSDACQMKCTRFVTHIHKRAHNEMNPNNVN